MKTIKIRDIEVRIRNKKNKERGWFSMEDILNKIVETIDEGNRK